MKLLRFTVVCSLLLLSATPSWALACKACTGLEPPYCQSEPDSGTRCVFSPRICMEYSTNCTGFSEESAPALLAEWTVASIEINRPAEGTKVVSSPAAVADAGLPQTAAHQ